MKPKARLRRWIEPIMPCRVTATFQRSDDFPAMSQSSQKSTPKKLRQLVWTTLTRIFCVIGSHKTDRKNILEVVRIQAASHLCFFHTQLFMHKSEFLTRIQNSRDISKSTSGRR